MWYDKKISCAHCMVSMTTRTAICVAWCLLAVLAVLALGILTMSTKPRVCILMFSTPNIVPEYSGLAAEINAAYARRHGYAFKHIVKPVDTHAETVWKMVDVLRAHHGQADALFWIDSDAVFNPAHHDRSLEWLFGLRGDIVGCSDHPNGPSVINTGTLFVKNTHRASDLLEQWWSMRKSYTEFPYEQKALEDLARENPDAITIRPAAEFNSVYGHLREGRRESFVLHFMSYKAEERAAEFTDLKETLASLT